MPLLQSSLHFARDPIAFFLQSHERYGPAFRLRAFDFNLTVMLGPSANRAVLHEHADKLSARKGYGLLLPLVSDALLVQDGEVHDGRRRLIAPAFHSSRIERYVAVMRDVAERTAGQWTDGGVIDIYAEAKRATLEIVMRALLGVDIGARYVETAEMFAHTFDYVTQPASRKIFRLDVPFTPYGRSVRAIRALDELLYGLIAQRRASGSTSDDVLSWLVDARDEDGQGLSDEAVRDQVLFLLYAGHDTAACALTWAMYELARHPGVADRLVRERADVLGAQALRLDNVRALTWLDAVVDETLRLYPPAWIGMRGVTESFVFDGKLIPAGTSVMYSPGASHRLPEVFKSPDMFLPERFLPENRVKVPAFAYVPYGGGGRTCVGMPFAQIELRVLVSQWLQRWRLSMAESGDRPIAKHYNPTLAPRSGIRLRVRTRG